MEIQQTAQFIIFMDIIGTIAFALSGAILAIASGTWICLESISWR